MAGSGGVQVITCEVRFRDTVSRGNFDVCLFVLINTDSLWARTSYKWGYNSYEWPYKWATEVTTSTTLLIGTIFLLITVAGHGAGGMSSSEAASQSNNPYASSGAVPRPGQTGAPSSSIKPQAGKPNLDVYAVGEFPPPAACNVVSTNVGPVPIGTFIEIRSGWSNGEASRLQAWILKSRDVGNKEGLLNLLRTDPVSAMKFSVDLAYRMKLSWARRW